MKSILLRTLGFAVPTLALVVALHLVKETSLGEALDGAVSGLWFVAFFLIGAWVAQRSGFARGCGGTHSELLLGAIASAGVWSLLWAFWALPLLAGLRLQAGTVLTVNTLSMAVAAFVVARVPLVRTRKGLVA